MRYKLLGKTRLRVSEIALGARTFGAERAWGASKDESRKIFDAYIAAGGNFIDTANDDTDGTSEACIAEFTARTRHRMVLATKSLSKCPTADQAAAAPRRTNIVQSVESSLRRLKTDYIDLYWVDGSNGLRPTEEWMRGLEDLVRSGKVLYVGLSNASVRAMARANTLASQYGWMPFSAIQVPYSLVERTAERELLPLARALDIAVMAEAPLGGGVLTGDYSPGYGGADIYTVFENNATSSHAASARTLAIAVAVQDVARETGCSPEQVALKWLRSHDGNVIPLVGASDLSQINDNLGCLAAELTASHLAKLDEVSHITLGFPYEFLALPFVRDVVYSVA